jgi:hypothetical protein
MIKECFQSIIDNTLDLGDKRKIALKRIIELYDEDQLYYMLQTPTGIITEDINIYFTRSTGFRCLNDWKLGRLPICNIFQKILNNKYLELSKK